MNPILLAMLLQNDPPRAAADSTRAPRPQMRAEYAARLGPVVDSLQALLPEGRVRSIERNDSPSREGSTSPAGDMRLTRPDRDVLLHEYGHLWARENPTAAEEVAGEARFDPYSRAGYERLANAFRDAFDALSRNDTTRLQPDVAGLVRRLVERPPFKKN